MLKVPESKIRVVAGDIGGSFGMKSAVYNEVALVLLASKRDRPPGEMDVARARNPFSATRRRATTSPTPSWRSTRTARFLGLRVTTIANIGAYLQTGMPAFTGNIGTLAGVYRTPAIHVDVTAVFTHTNPMRPYRGNGRPEAAYVIERMVDLAADELGIDPAELRRRNYIPPDSDAVQDRRSPSPMTAASSRRAWTWRSSSPTARASSSARAESRKQRQAARHRPIQHHRARRSGGLRRRGNPLRPVRHRDAACGQRHPGPGPRDHRSSRSCATGSASIPTTCTTSRAIPTRSSRRRHRRLALGHDRRARRSTWRREQDHRQGQADRRPPAQGRCRRHQLRRRRVLQPQDQPHPDHQGSCARTRWSRRSCRRTWMPA